MKIAPSAHLPQQAARPSTGSGDRGSATFGDLLAQLALSAASQPDGEATRAGAAEFGEMPIVLLTATALGGARSSRTHDAIDRLVQRVAEAAVSIDGRSAAHRSQAWSPLPARTAGTASRPAVQAISSAVPGASPVDSAADAQRPSGVLAGVHPGHKADAPASSSPDGAKAPAGKRTRLAGTGSSHGSSSLHAALIATEAGLKLVLRAARLSVEERAELSDRLAGLFADIGQVPPELVIYEPTRPDRKG